MPVLLALKFLCLCFHPVWTDWGMSCNTGLELLGRGSEELAVDVLDARDPSDAVGILQFAAICGALLGCNCCGLLGTAGFSLVCSSKEVGSAIFILRAFTASSLWQILLKLGYDPYFGSYLPGLSVALVVLWIWCGELSCAAGPEDPQPMCSLLLDGLGAARAVLDWGLPGCGLK